LDQVPDSPPLTAALFPGQGSQAEGMREQVERDFPDLAALAIELSGDDPFARADESTRFAQPAIFCASVAAWRATPVPDVAFMAGHSLGEFAALVAAGSISAEDGLRLVALRGHLMSELADAGTMLAVVGADAAELAGEIAQETGTYVANLNAPVQVVLSGSNDAIADAARVVTGRGLRAIELPVAGAFHSPLMEPAVEPFREALAVVDFADPSVPVFSAVTAAPFEDIARSLGDALVRPVRWSAVLEAMAEAGAGRFVEVGPGKVLTGLVKRNLRGVEAAHV
jgi:malonyl CoA-acyl carrier protein transacylase